MSHANPMSHTNKQANERSHRSLLGRFATVLALAFALAVPALGPAATSAHASPYKQGSKKELRKYNAGYRVTPGVWQPLRNRKRSSKAAKQYFIEFRARGALSYGHTSVITGKLRNGKIPKRNGRLIKGTYNIAGLAPKSDNPTLYMIGHVIPLPASTGWTDGDDEDAYQTAGFRIDLTHAEYKQINKLIERRKRASKFWNAAIYACVHFTADIAKDIGLKVPRGFRLPKSWVNTLAAVNRGV